MAEKKNNRKCIICGKAYKYCNSCREDSGKPTWYAIFDGDRCYELYEICTSYRDNVINKKTAFERISKCDISDLDNFNETTKAQIKDILTYKAESTNDKSTEDKIKSVQKAEKTNDSFFNKRSK